MSISWRPYLIEPQHTIMVLNLYTFSVVQDDPWHLHHQELHCLMISQWLPMLHHSGWCSRWSDWVDVLADLHGSSSTVSIIWIQAPFCLIPSHLFVLLIHQHHTSVAFIYDSILMLSAKCLAFLIRNQKQAVTNEKGFLCQMWTGGHCSEVCKFLMI